MIGWPKAHPPPANELSVDVNPSLHPLMQQRDMSTDGRGAVRVIRKSTVSQDQEHEAKEEDRSAMIWAFCLIAVLLWSPPVWAQAQVERVPWSQLTPSDQQYLQRFSEKWDQLPRQRQERLLNGVNKWRNMTPEERREAKERFQRWRELPPEQQQHLRERFQRFKNLPPEQQESLREARRWFKSLPPEQRQQLKGKWKNMTLEERQAFKKDFHRPSTDQDRTRLPVDQSDRR